MVKAMAAHAHAHARREGEPALALGHGDPGGTVAASTAAGSGGGAAAVRDVARSPTVTGPLRRATGPWRRPSSRGAAVVGSGCSAYWPVAGGDEQVGAVAGGEHDLVTLNRRGEVHAVEVDAGRAAVAASRSGSTREVQALMIRQRSPVPGGAAMTGWSGR